MTARIPQHVLDAICGTNWLITEEGLQSVLAIASRADAVGAGVPVIVPPALTETVNGVARIPIVGPILRYANLMTSHCGATALSQVAADFDAAIDDPAVTRVELLIDTPGGEARGVQNFSDVVYSARGRKPIVAKVESLAASAGYWIASAASSIELGETGSVGSIGVVLNVGRGVGGELQIVSRQSPRKRMDPASSEGRQALQEHVDQLGETFVQRVALFRNTTPERVLADFGQGWIRTGADAVRAGMADRLLGPGTAARRPGPTSTAALTAEQQWATDEPLRREFGFNRERWLAYASRPRRAR